MRSSKASEFPQESELNDDHEFDFENAQPNRFACHRGKRVALDQDVEAAFPSSDAVNAALRGLVAAMPEYEREALRAERHGPDDVSGASRVPRTPNAEGMIRVRVVTLAPDVADIFKTEEAVNHALRTLISAVPKSGSGIKQDAQE